MSYITLFSFATYLSLVMGFAIVAYYKTHSLADFVLAGRRLNAPVAALSAGASDMSAWLLLGLPGAVYGLGLSQIWLPIGLLLGAYISWRWVAKPLRVFSELANDSLTLPAYLDNRFFDQSGWIRSLLAGITLLFFAFYTASGLVGGAMLMQRFGLSYTQALYLGTAIIMLYTLVGGFFAVSWTDFFQGILMLLCLLIIPWLAIKELGGWSTVFSMIDSTTHWAMDPFNGSTDFFYINLLAWGLGYFGQPHILVRYMAIKSTVQLPLARRIAMSWMTLSMLGAVMTGWVGIAYFKPDQIVAESIFIAFSQVLLSPWLAGILLAAILSSIMCALDSQMLASASALTEDIYRRLLRPQATQAELIWLSRIAIVLIAGIAMALAFDPNRQVIELVAFAWAGLGAAFGPAVLWSLFWRRMTARGALYGIVVGALTVVLWHSNQGGIFELYAIIPGFVLSSLAILLGSGLDNPPATHITQQFDLAWDKINNYK